MVNQKKSQIRLKLRNWNTKEFMVHTKGAIINMNDKNVLELMKLTLKSKIKMCCHGETNVFHFSANPSDSDGFELYVDDKKKTVYGLSCNGIIEVIGVLIQDYANGIITDIEVIN